MAAELFIPPSKALDANANPYAGAKWFFYQTGTTTGQSVYTTAALSVAHANPVVADSSGKFANIFFDPSLTYRGVLKSADESVTLYDIDPINSGVLSQLAGASGTSVIGFQQSGTGARVRTAQDKLREQPVSLDDFSGTIVARMKAATAELLSRGGGTLLLPRDSYALSSTELATPISLPSNVIVEGEGSILTISGTDVIGSIFRSEDTSNVVIRNLLVVGNNQAVADATSGAFFNYVHTSSGAGAENIRVENVRLQNFKAERWISILNNNASAAIRGVRIKDVSCISVTGNNLGGSDIAIGANALMIYGNTAVITDVVIENFYCEADYIKTGINIFHKVTNVRIYAPTIKNAGQNGTSNDKGAYAINVYGDAGELSDVTIDDAVITSPRSCGIYLRGVSGTTINNPKITGQTDTVTGTLPKGAIVGNGASVTVINGGSLSGNVSDLSFVADTASTNFDLKVSNLKTRTASGSSILLLPATGTGKPDGVSFVDCDISGAGRALQMGNGSTRNFQNVSIIGGKWISTGSTALELHTADGFSLTNYRIQNCVIGASSNGISCDSPASTGTGDVTISNVTIYDSGTSAMTYGILARNMAFIYIDNVLVRDQGTGYATLLDGARGTINNLRIKNVASGFSPSSLGMVIPTGVGEVGWFVQKLNPVEAGTTPNKYVVTGWRYTTSWLEQRTLTGS